jgi:hypothetical protein
MEAKSPNARTCTSTGALPTKSETQAAQGKNTHLNTTARFSFLTPPTHYTHCFLLITHCSPLSQDPYLDLPSSALHLFLAEAQLLTKALPWRGHMFLTDPLLCTETLLPTDYPFLSEPLLWQFARFLQGPCCLQIARYKYGSPDCLGVSYSLQHKEGNTRRRITLLNNGTHLISLALCPGPWKLRRGWKRYGQQAKHSKKHHKTHDTTSKSPFSVA